MMGKTLETLLEMLTFTSIGAGFTLGITSDEPLTPYNILKLSGKAVGYGALLTPIMYGLKSGISGLYYLERHFSGKLSRK